MNTDHHLHGSREAWEEVFQDVDLSYSEKAINQGKLFELQKLSFLKEIFPKAPASILEVGCGSAFVSLYFAKRGYVASCLDINKFILKIAQENFRKEGVEGEFVVGDAEKLPFKENSFDVVSSFGLLEHFSDPTQAISEMVRVLKPGGLFFADIVPNRFSCQTIGNIFNSIAVLLYWTVKGKFNVAIKKARANFSPEYFENSISWLQYQKILQSLHLKNIQVRGNRPFPRLTLPKKLDYLYTQILKITTPFWRVFDRWDHSIPKIWGAGLWFWGKK